ncbi:MAG: hypothetical protein AKCLJLPJ_00421 [Fimbriimonadales bacterium]|nr:hypothetical protein [Fimbriimonadales bacterium]
MPVPLSSETYRRLASDLGYQQDALEKVLRLGEISREIGAHELLADVLVLKGGTALNLKHEEPPRLSVDLDFDYIGAVDREGMLKQRPQVLDAIALIARTLNYQVSGPGENHAGSSFQLRYQNSLGTQDELKVDLTWTNRVQVALPERRVLWQPESVERPTVLVASEEDLVGGKFRAMLDRVAARDVFDAAEIARSYEDWPPESHRSAIVFLTGTLPLRLTKYDESRIDLLSDEEAEQNLRAMIRAGSALDIPSMKKDAKAALAVLFRLTDTQREFIERLHGGALAPELLFGQEDAERLRRHPHLLWKVANVRRHSSH